MGIFVLVGLAVFTTSRLGKLANISETSQSQLGAVVLSDFSSMGGNFAVLADTAITNTPTSVITGDVGLGPTSGGSSYSGLTTAEVSGTIYATDASGPAGGTGNNSAIIISAKNALTASYLDAESRTPTTTFTAIHDLGGATLTPGVYNDPSSLGITGTLTLDGQGNPDAVFIFQAGSTLITEAGSKVVLINSAQSCNIFWQVGSSATLKTNSEFYGNILALSSITLQSGASIEGTALARNGAVTLNHNVINKLPCVTPPPAPSVSASASSGGGYNAPLPLINVTKIPSPLALASGPGPVTYTYKVTNVGKVPMYGVWVRDNKCNDVKFVSGDTNNDEILDMSEAWIYTCTKTVSQTETDTAMAHGQSNGWDGYDTANATVVVGLPLTPPLIHLVKKPSVFVLPLGGGPVTYTYTVTNPGTVPLSDVSIVDDKCTGLPGRVVGHPGDLNKNNLLESNETWTFTCQTNIAKTTTNIGTAEGHANGLTALDFSPATVVVSDTATTTKTSTPTLPKTGFPPKENDTH